MDRRDFCKSLAAGAVLAFAPLHDAAGRQRVSLGGWGHYTTVKFNQLWVNERPHPLYASMDELIESIQRVGLQHALTVTPRAGGHFRVIHGIHRYWALHKLHNSTTYEYRRFGNGKLKDVRIIDFQNRDSIPVVVVDLTAREEHFLLEHNWRHPIDAG